MSLTSMFPTCSETFPLWRNISRLMPRIHCRDGHHSHPCIYRAPSFPVYVLLSRSVSLVFWLRRSPPVRRPSHCLEKHQSSHSTDHCLEKHQSPHSRDPLQGGRPLTSVYLLVPIFSCLCTLVQIPVARRVFFVWSSCRSRYVGYSRGGHHLCFAFLER